jgi:2,4-dienoyl-CoA reductase-like NADH-dependent reductase (Old Yellow Enzyme family)
MCQYSAKHGLANDWHFAHLSRFGLGGFGAVVVEATAVVPEGRITYADLGLWSDEQIVPLARIVDFLHTQSTAAAIQIGHAGRKAATPLWWRGGFTETEDEKPQVGFEDWQPVAPSAVPHASSPDYKMPRELTVEEIASLRQAFVDAARRADRAGFDIVEIHGAHGYLINEFLSPIANRRTDAYGGSEENRMRFLLEIAESVRAAWPADKPLFVRLSASDNHPDGNDVDFSVRLASRLKALGVDLVDCSSGGFDGARFDPAPNYQVPLAATIRDGANIPTMAVGLITDPNDAEAIIASGKADLVALGRGALDEPNWPLHARLALDPSRTAYGDWPKQAGFAVSAMDRTLKQRGFSDR